jgi:Kef-type K+ transport system membrane component KefB
MGHSTHAKLRHAWSLHLFAYSHSCAGYLVSGIICGPYVLGILSTSSLMDLNIIDSACLGIIGLAAGAELDLPQLAKSRKQVHPFLSLPLFLPLSFCLTLCASSPLPPSHTLSLCLPLTRTGARHHVWHLPSHLDRLLHRL